MESKLLENCRVRYAENITYYYDKDTDELIAEKDSRGKLQFNLNILANLIDNNSYKIGGAIFTSEKVKLDQNKKGTVKNIPIAINNDKNVYGWIRDSNEAIDSEATDKVIFDNKSFVYDKGKPKEEITILYNYYNKDAKIITFNANDII